MEMFSINLEFPVLRTISERFNVKLRFLFIHDCYWVQMVQYRTIFTSRETLESLYNG